MNYLYDISSRIEQNDLRVPDDPVHYHQDYKPLVRPESFFDLHKQLFRSGYPSIRKDKRRILFSPLDILRYKGLAPYQVTHIFFTRSDTYLQLLNGSDVHFFIDKDSLKACLGGIKDNHEKADDAIQNAPAQASKSIEEYIKARDERLRWLAGYGFYTPTIYETLHAYLSHPKADANSMPAGYSYIRTPQALISKDLFIELHQEYQERSKKMSELSDAVVKENMPFIAFFAAQARRRFPWAEHADLIQEGSIGLVKSLNDYDADTSSFQTYAAYRIKAYIHSFCKKDTVIQYPTRYFTRHYQIESAADQLGTQDPASIAGYTGLPLKQVQKLQKEKVHDIFSIDQPLGTDGNYHETIASDTFPEPSHQEHKASVKRTLQKYIDPLPIRSRIIFNKYFFDDMTYEDIAKQLGLTKQAINQSIEKSLRKIRNSSRKDGLLADDL